MSTKLVSVYKFAPPSIIVLCSSNNFTVSDESFARMFPKKTLSLPESIENVSASPLFQKVLFAINPPSPKTTAAPVIALFPTNVELCIHAEFPATTAPPSFAASLDSKVELNIES